MITVFVGIRGIAFGDLARLAQGTFGVDCSVFAIQQADTRHELYLQLWTPGRGYSSHLGNAVSLQNEHIPARS